MICDKCGLDASIVTSGTEITGDDSPDTQTTIFTVLTYACRNPHCERYRKQIGQTRHQVYPVPVMEIQNEEGGESE